jgi:two-component system phosphate regulon sensor histidine kinase PhoR
MRDAELKEARRIANQVKMLQRHFIHNVNHELRTPLLQIKTSISMLSDIIRTAVSNKQAHTLAEKATQATARLEGVVQNITQLEVFENSRREPMVLRYAISAATKHFSRSWAHQEDTKRILTYLGVELPPVIGDQRAVTRILIALIENALKFSDADKNVEISIRWLREDNVAWVGVKDYGIGIPDDKAEEIFEPFTQLDMGSTREYGGLGVGLTIAQMLARGMGTQIHVKSTVGEGSLFWFVLPILEDFAHV